MSPSRRPVCKIGVIDLGLEEALLPNGMTLELPVIRHPGASAIVAMDEREAIVLLTQYRHAVGGWYREIPAGCRKEGESYLECAKRELAEETGLGAATWHRLGAIYTIPSFCDERIELFLARDLVAVSGQADPDEVIRLVRVELKAALAMVRQGAIVDAKTIAALHHVDAFLHKDPSESQVVKSAE
ncbi:MAG TPA: NUDIX hydrolase [Candidatus Binataceae bacterium]|jgi:ADP-ribose pyrophosphatase|nr:NUDIX hydrolase [Candidatus Binataceae bacterium]